MTILLDSWFFFSIQDAASNLKKVLFFLKKDHAAFGNTSILILSTRRVVANVPAMRRATIGAWTYSHCSLHFVCLKIIIILFQVNIVFVRDSFFVLIQRTKNQDGICFLTLLKL
jgi:hypothetical protein